MIVSNDNFNNVDLNSDIKTSCSPDVGTNSSFLGIAINMPTEVNLQIDKQEPNSNFIEIPLCGFYQLDMAELVNDAVIRFIMVNVDTSAIHQGVFIEREISIDATFPIDETALKIESVEGQLIAAYFNANLAKYISLPIQEATYRVSVQIGTVKSNIVELKLTHQN